MITLREIARDDIPTINRWRSDPHVTDGFASPPRFIGIDVDLQWYDDYLKRRAAEVRCAICLAGSGQLVGMVSLTRIDYTHRNAEFHIVVGERASQNGGLGTAAAREMVRHALFDLNLHRLSAFVLSDNVRSIRVCEKAGFRTEGRIREGAYKAGAYRDLIVMGVLKTDLPFEAAR